MEASGKPRRVDVGFSGGQILSMRLAPDAYESLRAAVAHDGAARWHELQTDDSQVQLDLAQIVYVRVDTERDRIGF
ncbi:MAG: hypothetical protein NVS3B10_26590 [Polyangiales bacterium]